MEEYGENKKITEKQINNDIEKEDTKNIKYLSENFQILKDRRTLQICLKEKYKFKKIFSIINNNYISEL